jgi:hypothetical protein
MGRHRKGGKGPARAVKPERRIYTTRRNSNNTEIDEESSNISGKYTALNHLCFKTGYSCQMITNFNVSVTSLLCK